MSESSNLQLLLSYDDDGSAVLKDGMPNEAASNQEPPTQEARDAARKKSSEAADFWEPGDDPQDLEAQRWGVIVPEGELGDQMLDWIKPLIDFRREQQDVDEVKIYRAPAKLSPKEAWRWRKTEFQKGNALSKDLPRYQVFLGNLDQMPLSLQQVMVTDGYTGRLCFKDKDGYRAYAEKVVQYEQASPKVQGRAKCLTVNDGTAATMIGQRSLMQPGLEILREESIEMQDVGEDAGSPTEFMELVRSEEPTMLFTVSHGAGAPRGGWKTYDEQLARQGAMSFGREGKLSGADVGDEAFLPGGIWFMLACYGAGTPDESAYKRWLQRLKAAGQFGGQADSVLAGLPKGELPFIANLPQTVLAKPNGPLAIMGHVDLAWTYSFEERDIGKKPLNRPGKFMDLVYWALKNDRVGISFREFIHFMTHATHEIAELYNEAEDQGEGVQPDGARLGHLWMLRQDLAGYILLGDPAARLPAIPFEKKKKKKDAVVKPASVPDVQGPAAEPFAAAAPATPAEPPIKLPIEIDRLEEAIGRLLAGEGWKALATEYGIDGAELRKLKDIYSKAGRAALGEK